MRIGLLVRNDCEHDQTEIQEINLDLMRGRRLHILVDAGSRETCQVVRDHYQRFQSQFGEPYEAVVFSGFSQEWIDWAAPQIGCQAIIHS